MGVYPLFEYDTCGGKHPMKLIRFGIWNIRKLLVVAQYVALGLLGFGIFEAVLMLLGSWGEVSDYLAD